MEAAPNQARVVPVERAEPTGADGIVLGGQLIEVVQNHLLEPFVGLLAAIEGLATVAATGGQGGPGEEASVRALYRSLYHFFHTLLPSAGHPAIDGLTYSAALLMVGEAIEAARIVVAPSNRTEVRGRK
jgi:hypothetical protein